MERSISLDKWPPLYCFFRGEGDGGDARPGSGRNPSQKKQWQPIRCKSCGQPIAEKKMQFAVNGSHHHTFFNPAGVVFELGTYRDAPGCSISGSPTGEFTWFAGYLWRYSLCRGCGRHLGWFYEKGESSFFALIATKLEIP